MDEHFDLIFESHEIRTDYITKDIIWSIKTTIPFNAKFFTECKNAIAKYNNENIKLNAYKNPSNLNNNKCLILFKNEADEEDKKIKIMNMKLFISIKDTISENLLNEQKNMFFNICCEQIKQLEERYNARSKECKLFNDRVDFVRNLKIHK